MNHGYGFGMTPNCQDRFAEFPTADGWLDGDGKATTEAAKALIVAILDRLGRIGPFGVPEARIYPTPAGGVQAEWSNDWSDAELRVADDGQSWSFVAHCGLSEVSLVDMSAPALIGQLVLVVDWFDMARTRP